jgi:hypothetical protein
VRGIAYQSYFWYTDYTSTHVVNDPLGEAYSHCLDDIRYFQRLNINVVRTYVLDLNIPDHGPCLNALADAGIYVYADLSTVNATLNMNFTWDQSMLNQFTAAVDTLAVFTNVLGLGIGNPRGVFSVENPSSPLPIYKAALRDIKLYIEGKGYRDIPVGIELGTYSDYDRQWDITDQVDYSTCDQIRPDFIGVTFLYEETSGSYNCTPTSLIDDIIGKFSSSPVPMFISGHGCYLPEGNPT